MVFRNKNGKDSKKGGTLLSGDQRLYTLKLVNVSDYFDADALWDKKYGGNPKIEEHQSKDPSLRLYKALDTHRRRESQVKGDQSSWLEMVSKVFSDVAVRIPESVWADQRQLGFEDLKVLLDTLPRLHKQSFGDQISKGRAPSYALIPDQHLKKGEIVFHFGLGVFIPSPADQKIGEIRMRIDEGAQWQPLDAFWVLDKDGRPVSRPPAIYQGQEALRISPDISQGAVGAPSDGETALWHAHGKGHIYLNFREQTNKSQALAESDGQFLDRGKLHKASDDFHRTVFVFANGQTEKTAGRPDEPADNDKIWVEINFSQAAIEARREDPKPAGRRPPMEPPKPQETPSEPENGREGKNAAGDHSKPFGEYALVLDGFALPRIDKFKIDGLEGWRLPILSDGRPLAAGEQEIHTRQPVLTLTANNGSTRMQALMPDGQSAGEISNFPWTRHLTDDLRLRIEPPPDEGFFLGLLRAASPQTLAVLGRQPLSIGPSSSNPDKHPDIALDILQAPECLQWASGRPGQPGQCMGRINLSSRHASVELNGGRLEIRILKGSTAVFGLDARRRFKSCLRPKEKGKLTLEPGEYLIIGTGLLRFVGPGMEAEPETDRDIATIRQNSLRDTR